jgi:TRAP-type C4-dicarboxylate transport system permease small subunit
MTRHLQISETEAVVHDRFAGRYRYVLDRIDAVVSWIIIVSMAAMTSVIFIQVIFRYFFNQSLSWGWDIPRLSFIWLVLLSIPLGIKYNAHVGLDFLNDRVTDGILRFLRRFNAFFMILLSVVATWFAAKLGVQTADQMMPGVPLSVSLFYVALAISQVHSMLHLLPIVFTGEPPTGHLSET